MVMGGSFEKKRMKNEYTFFHIFLNESIVHAILKDLVHKAMGETLEIGLLEIKDGLLQLAESLNFLHSNAHLIHRAISPEVLPESIGAMKPYLQQFIDV
uniref:Uncharacterized protein n=1 Tax=Cucumis melo TaxID=3656 RepID=A0A9I9EJ54_CUCME